MQRSLPRQLYSLRFPHELKQWHCIILPNSLTPWNRFLLQKLSFLQLVKKFMLFYGTWWLITPFTWASHFPSTEPDHTRSTPPILCHEDPFKYRRPNYTCFFQVVSFPLASQRKTYMHLSVSFVPLPYPTHFYCSSHSQNTEWGVKIMKLSSLCSFLQSHLTFPLFSPNIFPHIL